MDIEDMKVDPKMNVLEAGIDPELGVLWTDGVSVFQTSLTDSDCITWPSSNNTKTLGTFSDVVSCACRPCDASEQNETYLAVQQKTQLVIWRVTCTCKHGSDKDPIFQILHTLEQRGAGRRCRWHPSRLLLLIITRADAKLFNLQTKQTVCVYRGKDVREGVWTKDGETLVLAVGQHIHIFKMDEDGGVQDASVKAENALNTLKVSGIVCAMTAISDHLVALATELPLQKVVTALSADLFSAEPSRAKLHTSDSEKTRKGNSIGEIHTVKALGLSCSDEPSPWHSSTMEGKVVGDTAASDSKASCCAGRADAKGRADLMSGARTLLDNALSKHKGAIDLTELLSNKFGNSAGAGNCSGQSGDEGGSPRGSDLMSPVCTEAIRAETDPPKDRCDGKREKDGQNFSHCEVSHSETMRCNNGQSDPPAVSISKTVEVEVTGLGAAVPKINHWGTDGASVTSSLTLDEDTVLHGQGEMVDLTSLQCVDIIESHRLKYAEQPDATSCAQLMLYDTRTGHIVSSLPIEGIITPSLLLLHVHENGYYIIAGSHSSRSLSVYSIQDNVLSSASMMTQLEDSERPIGLCSLPGSKGTLLLAVTKAESQDALPGSVLPSSGRRKRKPLFKAVPLDVKSRTPETTAQTCEKSHEGEITSSPGRAGDTRLATLLLPGGRALSTSEQSVGRRLGIEVLQDRPDMAAVEGKTGGKASDTPRRAAKDVIRSVVYPPPELAETVVLSFQHHSGTARKSFILHDGQLCLSSVQKVFHLVQPEIRIGSRWVVLAADSEGLIPLTFSNGSCYEVREAVL